MTVLGRPRRMATKKTTEDLNKHKYTALKKLENLIDTYIAAKDSRVQGKADKLCYWLEDYAKFLDFEPNFNPTSFRRYKKGEIIKVHLGYNIGCEEGGLHYAVVVEKDNSIYSPTVCIVPLTSVKPKTDITKLHNSNIYLGNEIFNALNAKLATHETLSNEKKNNLQKRLDDLYLEDMRTENKEIIVSQLKSLNNELNKEIERDKIIKKMVRETSKLKQGSIALVLQITTISKIRIYDPKTNNDVLSKIKLSNANLDLLDAKIKELFLK